MHDIRLSLLEDGGPRWACGSQPERLFKAENWAASYPCRAPKSPQKCLFINVFFLLPSLMSFKNQWLSKKRSFADIAFMPGLLLTLFYLILFFTYIHRAVPTSSSSPRELFRWGQKIDQKNCPAELKPNCQPTDLKEAKELALWVSDGRAFQAKGWVCGKVLR